MARHSQVVYCAHNKKSFAFPAAVWQMRAELSRYFPVMICRHLKGYSLVSL